jgi:hypothetical protein
VVKAKELGVIIYTVDDFYSKYINKWLIYEWIAVGAGENIYINNIAKYIIKNKIKILLSIK